MKKMICFVLVSFLGGMFSLGGKSKVNNESVNVTGEGVVYPVTFYAYEDGSGKVEHLREALPLFIRHYADSFGQIGYTIRYDANSWEYPRPYRSFDVYFFHNDSEYAELTIAHCVKDFGRHLIAFVNVGSIGMYARLQNGMKIEMW